MLSVAFSPQISVSPTRSMPVLKIGQPPSSVSAALAAVVVHSQDLVEIPADLSFSCADRPYGYYADAQTNCQVRIRMMKNELKQSFPFSFTFWDVPSPVE